MRSAFLPTCLMALFLGLTFGSGGPVWCPAGKYFNRSEFKCNLCSLMCEDGMIMIKKCGQFNDITCVKERDLLEHYLQPFIKENLFSGFHGFKYENPTVKTYSSPCETCQTDSPSDTSSNSSADSDESWKTAGVAFGLMALALLITLTAACYNYYSYKRRLERETIMIQYHHDFEGIALFVFLSVFSFVSVCL